MIVEQTPQRLVEVEGIGPNRSRRIIASWAEHKVICEIMAFLQGYGVSPARALRIFKAYGADAIPLVSENPYRLTRDSGGIRAGVKQRAAFNPAFAGRSNASTARDSWQAVQPGGLRTSGMFCFINSR